MSTPFWDSQVEVQAQQDWRNLQKNTRSFNLKLSANIRPGAKYREFSLKILYKVKKLPLALGIRVGLSLFFLEKYVISMYFWCIKGKSPWNFLEISLSSPCAFYVISSHRRKPLDCACSWSYIQQILAFSHYICRDSVLARIKLTSNKKRQGLEFGIT